MPITYTDKVQNAVNPLPITEQFRAVDANEIKTVVNTHIADVANPHAVTKAQVGLSNVPNLSFSGSNTGDQDISVKVDKINTAVALVDGASMDLTATKHTLASSSATRTFTISYTGDDIILDVILSAVTSTYTFPGTALVVSEGVASGNNTGVLTGVSGDHYIIGIKKIGSNYFVIIKNFGQ